MVRIAEERFAEEGVAEAGAEEAGAVEEQLEAAPWPGMVRLPGAVVKVAACALWPEHESYAAACWIDREAGRGEEAMAPELAQLVLGVGRGALVAGGGRGVDEVVAGAAGAGRRGGEREAGAPARGGRGGERGGRDERAADGAARGAAEAVAAAGAAVRAAQRARRGVARGVRAAGARRGAGAARSRRGGGAGVRGCGLDAGGQRRR